MLEKLDQLELILEVFFRCYPAQAVLQHCDEFSGILEKDYVKLAFHHATKKRDYLFSQEDLSNQFRYFQQRMVQEAWRRDCEPCREGYLDPMECLFYYAQKMLRREENQVVCSYRQLLNWRNLTLSISEDLPVAAYLAATKRPDELNRNDLNWKLVVGHDNFQLQRIMERGLAENHFHLYGSAPVFHLSWISMMNRLTGSKAAARLRKFDRERNSPEMKVNTTLFEPSLYVQHLQAATIRLFLFIAINQEENPDFGCSVLRDLMRGEEQEQRRLQNKEKQQREDQEQRTVQSKVERQRFVSEKLHQLVDLLFVRDAKEAERFLELEDRANDIQSSIDSLRDWDAPSLPDYALLGCPLDWDQDTAIFQGERWLLYQCLHRIRHQMFPPKYKNLLYTYLILKERIRHELIHIEDGVGFSHFQDYERRKFDLMEDSILLEDVARSAMRSDLLNPNIRSLEIRLSPYDSGEENAARIRKLDEIMGGPQHRFFYTFHFLKRPDDWHEKDKNAFYHRHYAFRRFVQTRTNAICALRERYPRRAERVLGIDAAAQEIDCRPEVFAVSFRYLHQHTAELEESAGSRLLPQLRRTYHVGEDFLDVTDGLRAIDEAIRFLGLESGDRLGHALALGIDVREWYAAKNNVITLPKQDYLDNVVWLYHQLLNLNQPDKTALQEYLKREFSIYFGELYQKNMSDDDFASCVFRRYQKDKDIPPMYRWNQYEIGTVSPFDIYQYYQAWKLRGDDPALYDAGYFKAPLDESLYEECRVNRNCPIDFGIRYNPGVFLIHYHYHYSDAVRREGEHTIQREVTSSYIEAVAQVQKAMQQKVAEAGLGIECNPTSNTMIGTFRQYENHPILRFYNRELEMDAERLEESPQLLVSINTDDQGVFSTSLENEYALMACALEKAENPDGSKRYRRQLIYSWLDAIRKMGLEQSFGKQTSERFGERRRFRISAIRRQR